MANETVYFKGKCKWAKLVTPSTQWNKWSIVLYPDEKSLEQIRDLQAQGVKNVLKKDEDGYNITLSRPTSLTVKGKIVGMSPPEVLNGAKKLEDGSYQVLKDTMIGNGSDVIVKMQVYQHRVPGTDKKAKAMRLESVRVDNLIPYTINRDFDEDQKKQVEGLSEQPEQLF